MLVFDTIVALSTPPYRSALALVRLSGEKSFEILSHLMQKKISDLEPNHAYFLKLRNLNGDIIDEAMVTIYKGPKSYTGFDSVDFSIHGSMIVAEELINAIVSLGARRAEKGEFSAQAYFNGKMDLLKAEGINDLINATSQRAKAIATQTLSGKNTAIVTELKTNLLDYLSNLEYFVESQYDEDQSDDYTAVLDEVKEKIDREIGKLDILIHNIKNANREYNGFTIAIAGEPNVGKSTLLNALLKEDKAIVSPIPGTTRDVVEGETEINGITFRFKDTAGLRKTDDYVENLGIERSYKTMRESDLILLASDIDFNEIIQNEEIMTILSSKPYIKIATKKDLHSEIEGADISVCSLQDDLTPLIHLILQKLDLNQKENSCFLGKREEEYLCAIQTQLKKTSAAIEDTHQVDIISDTLRTAIVFINDLMGNNSGKTMEDIYQTLFSKFCLGK